MTHISIPGTWPFSSDREKNMEEIQSHRTLADRQNMVDSVNNVIDWLMEQPPDMPRRAELLDAINHVRGYIEEDL